MVSAVTAVAAAAMGAVRAAATTAGAPVRTAIHSSARAGARGLCAVTDVVADLTAVEAPALARTPRTRDFQTVSFDLEGFILVFLNEVPGNLLILKSNKAVTGTLRHQLTASKLAILLEYSAQIHL